MVMCVNCKFADLTDKERLTFRLTGGTFLYECLHPFNYREFSVQDYYHSSNKNHDCNEYKPCPES